ncbi:hypothetical protein [Anaerobiospirillum sp. NML120449]|uniref:hypothetical protein n=1 Tax=Anaerobiospirillum sp. NML120449 TaxID=2932817 RepID=UPI001FF0F3D6|nr:hypothetical protein [Anaerobiospirillum sp. NML120449]MCK0526475.1 hypothetical protein [Anaerobiospirillum sp. NML120449]
MKFKDAATAKFCEKKKKKAYLMPTYSSYKNSLREFLKLSISCAAVEAVHCSSFRAFLLSVSDSEVLLKVPLSVTFFPGVPVFLSALSLDPLLGLMSGWRVWRLFNSSWRLGISVLSYFTGLPGPSGDLWLFASM